MVVPTVLATTARRRPRRTASVWIVPVMAMPPPAAGPPLGLCSPAAGRVKRASAAISHGHRHGGGGGTATVDRTQNQAVRDWARSKGIAVSDRGRIPAHISEQYQREAGR